LADVMIRTLTLDTGEDLAPFSVYLWQQRIAHRIYEEHGKQVLEVDSVAADARVREDFAAWREGRLQLRLQPLPRPTAGRYAAFVRALTRYPVLCAVLVLAVLCYPATIPLEGGAVGAMLPWLTIVPVDVDGVGASGLASLWAVLATGQFWRLVTPIFIHFGVVHLLFNVAIVVEFGRRIERSAGSLCLLVGLLLIAVCSNTAQFVAADAALFGGLSGVAYGLFGYVVVRGRFDAGHDWQVNRAFTVAMLLILVLMSSGITELFGLYIANAAHWAGLGAGGLLALAWRPRPGSDAS
jgi:rhomboid protease GlpG